MPDYERKRKQLALAGRMISCSLFYTVGLQSDGGIVSGGWDDSENQCKVLLWSTYNIVAISSGSYHTAGLTSKGTVLACGRDDDRQCEVSDWQDIVEVSGGGHHTVGLKSDGTVVACGSNSFGQRNVSDWRDIVAVACGTLHTVGLKSDGTVVSCGNNEINQCNVSDWRDIVSVSCGHLSHTVGLKSDGTVVACGENNKGQCDVSMWRDIVSVSCGATHTLGIKSDGTVIACGENDAGQCNVSNWRDIVAVSCGYGHTFGLRSDGTVIVLGMRGDGVFDISGWKLFNSIDTIEKEKQIIEEQRRQIAKRHIEIFNKFTSYKKQLHRFAGTDSRWLFIKEDGTVKAYGKRIKYFKGLKIKYWNDIKMVAIGDLADDVFAAGLKNDGTVVALTSYRYCSDFDFSHLKDIVQIGVSSRYCLYALKSDGTMANFKYEKDIIYFCVDDSSIAFLHSDGTVTGYEFDKGLSHKFDTADWNNIIDIKVTGHVLTGLAADGTIIASKCEKGDRFSSIKKGELVIPNAVGLANIDDYYHNVCVDKNGRIIYTGSKYFKRQGKKLAKKRLKPILKVIKNI